MSLINISLCLSYIPKIRIKQAENGKKYINIVCAKRKELGKYEETHTVFCSQTKEEREAGAEKIYIGSGKEFIPQSSQPVTPESIDAMPPIGDEDDGLPF